MSILPLTFPERSKILVAGAGGGFDFVCGLPIILALEAQGHEVHIANYSFTNLFEVEKGKWHSENLLEITADSLLKTGDYFPEKYLAQWYKNKKNVSRSIWCLGKVGVVPTTESYNYLMDLLGIEIVLCIDGGVDGIFRGDECDLGTPSMDSISVIAASLSKAKRKIYACTAFGTEGNEGNVSHAQVLNRMAELIREGAFIGVGTIRPNCVYSEMFAEAVQFMFEKMSPLRRSIVVSTLLAAMRGKYGRIVVHEKTRDCPPWISPLTSLFWYFEAEAVAKLKLFYEKVKTSTSVLEVSETIEALRGVVPIKPFEAIPL